MIEQMTYDEWFEKFYNAKPEEKEDKLSNIFLGMFFHNSRINLKITASDIVHTILLLVGD